MAACSTGSGAIAPASCAAWLQGRYLLAGLDAKAAVAAPDFADTFAQLLIEKFLVAADDGWILRQARFYRGAIQEEDERDGARKLLTAMAARPEWIGFRYPALLSGARLLPHGEEGASAQTVRAGDGPVGPGCGLRSSAGEDPQRARRR